MDVRALAPLLATVVAVLLSIAAVPAASAPRSAVARVVLDPAGGATGTTVTVSGTGFAARAGGTVAAAGARVAVRADAKGAFVVRIAIPAGASGTVELTADVGDRTAAAPFAVRPPTAPRFGVTTPGGPSATGELDEVARVAGAPPALVMWYADWRQEPPVAGLGAVAARGAVPMITWEPWVAGAGTVQPDHALATIAAGRHDAYVRRWATALAAWDKPVLLRFAHEMNGDWYPWSEAINGNARGDYAAAWRHVHDVFTAAGATNVRWVWSPNVAYPGSIPLAELYPGADAVDVVALDGYNRGLVDGSSTWVGPAALFGPTFDELRALAADKELMIAETASSELGGSKADWIADLFAWLRTQPDIGTVVWFDHDKEADWRIQSSPSAAAAFAAGLAARR